MRFFRTMGTVAVCGAMLLGLSACTEGGTPTANSAAQEQMLICYDYGYGDSNGTTRVFNSAGKLIAKTGVDGYEDIWTMTDEYGRQMGVALIKHTYSPDEFDEWGHPLAESVTYSILDTDGNEVSHVTIDNPGDVRVHAPKGVANEILFFNYVTDDSAEDGVSHFEIYDKMGELMLSETLTADFDDINTNDAYADYNGELLIVNHDVWDSRWEDNYHKCYVYAKQYDSHTFTEKQLDKDYRDIHLLYNNNGDNLSYWQAQYYPTPDTPMYDILNPDGTIAIEGLNSVLSSGSNMIFARIGNDFVLLDMQGNRLYTESAFYELSD